MLNLCLCFLKIIVYFFILIKVFTKLSIKKFSKDIYYLVHKNKCFLFNSKIYLIDCVYQFIEIYELIYH